MCLKSHNCVNQQFVQGKNMVKIKALLFVYKYQSFLLHFDSKCEQTFFYGPRYEKVLKKNPATMEIAIYELKITDHM